MKKVLMYLLDWFMFFGIVIIFMIITFFLVCWILELPVMEQFTVENMRVFKLVTKLYFIVSVISYIYTPKDVYIFLKNK